MRNVCTQYKTSNEEGDVNVLVHNRRDYLQYLCCITGWSRRKDAAKNGESLPRQSTAIQYLSVFST